MLHKVILGGEEFLPFARSCVTKLKKLGLSHASQAFEVGGVSIKVRIEPGHEYIRIGGGCSVGIDSGVVELFPLTTTVTQFWDPVYLHETAEGAVYNAAFTDVTPGSLTDDSAPATRSNPAKGSSGQIAGLLTYSSGFSGSIPDKSNRTRSFAAFVSPTSGDPVRWEYAELQEKTVEKKKLVGECPASIFTGRCRAYVQAMYGAYQYTDPHKEDSYSLKLKLRKMFGVAPRLVIEGYVSRDDTTTYPEVVLTTSSGVYMDKDTGEHWLINPSDTDLVTIFPLKSNKCGESLRRVLVKPPKGMLKRDIDRVESYILAYSQPDLKNAQKLTIVGSRHSADAMGYGWHWNYSGTVADRVINTNYRQTRPENYGWPPTTDYDPWGVESVHSRLTLTLAKSEGAAPVLTIATSVVSSSKWAVNRGIIVLIEPSWNDFARARKTTATFSVPFTSSGVFYAFYTGDELQLCTVTVTETPTTVASFQSSDPLYAAGYPATYPADSGNIDVFYYGRTYGFRGGYYDHVSKQGWYHTVTVSVGSVTHSNLVIGQHKDGVTDVTSVKTMSSGPTSWSSPTVYLYGDYATGDPMDEGATTITVLEDLRTVSGRSRAVSDGFGMLAAFTVSRHNYTVDVSSSSVIAVSSTDAEVVFVQSEKIERRFDSGHIAAVRQADDVINARRFTEVSSGGSSVGGPIFTYNWTDNATLIEEPVVIDPKNTEVQLFKSSVMVCSAGVVQCKDDWDLSPTVWYYESDFTFEDFRAISGAHGTVVIPAKKYCDPIGFSPELLDPAIVGYA